MTASGAIIVSQPATAVVFPQPDGGPLVIAPTESTVVVLNPQGPPGGPGANAVMDVGFGFENFSAGQMLDGVFLAHPIDSTDTVSIAGTKTPPSSIAQVVALYVNGSQIGTATWGIGDTFAVVDTGNYAFVRGDFLQFGAPDSLDPNFSHFAITYAGP